MARRRLQPAAEPVNGGDDGAPFKVGDKVRLGGIGPTLICIEWQRGDPDLLQDAGWRCAWFVQRAVRYALLPASVLQIAPPDAD